MLEDSKIKTNKTNICIICSEFNKEIVEDLLYFAKQELLDRLGGKDFIITQKQLETHPTYQLSKEKSEKELFFVKRSEKKLFTIKNLDKNPKKEYNIQVYDVAGAGEIPLAVKWAADQKIYAGILALGAIIKGATTHYDSLCRILENSVWDLQKQYSLPIIFSILMLENKEQSNKIIEPHIKESPEHSNKEQAKTRAESRSQEAVKSLLQMMQLKKQIELGAIRE